MSATGIFQGSAGIHGAIDEGIHVIDVEVNGHRRALECLGRKRPPLRPFVDQHDRSTANLDRRMQQLAVLTRQPRHLEGTERLL
jgi:hypothetical protein